MSILNRCTSIISERFFFTGISNKKLPHLKIQQPKSAINFRSTRGGTVKKQLRQPSPDIESESDDSGESKQPAR